MILIQIAKQKYIFVVEYNYRNFLENRIDNELIFVNLNSLLPA